MLLEKCILEKLDSVQQLSCTINSYYVCYAKDLVDIHLSNMVVPIRHVTITQGINMAKIEKNHCKSSSSS